MANYEFHPATHLFPLMGEAELEELAEDIRNNGLRKPIEIFENRVLDGRNRLLACRKAGVEPQFSHLEKLDLESPVLHVVAKNPQHHKDLTVSQRGALAAEVWLLLKEEIARRPRGHPWKDRGRSVAAKSMGVGEDTVRRAAVVWQYDPAAFERIRRGELTVNTAYEKLPESCRTRRQAILAEATKRKMIEGLSYINGLCTGLSMIKIPVLQKVLSRKEINEWAGKAASNAKILRRFGLELRKREAEPDHIQTRAAGPEAAGEAVGREAGAEVTGSENPDDRS